jgi:hypothetical protein
LERMDVTSKPDLGAFSQFSATIMVAAPMAFLVSLALLRIYRRTVTRTMQRRVAGTLGAASGLMGVLENTPAGSGEQSGHPLQIMPHDAPTGGVSAGAFRRWGRKTRGKCQWHGQKRLSARPFSKRIRRICSCTTRR